MTELTEKNLADALRNAHAEHSETDWTALARKAAELMGVDLPPEPKPLPTEPGSVIIATEVRGVKGEWRAFLEQDGNWTTSEFINGCIWHNPMRITAWTEALVVPVTDTPVTLTEDQVGEEWNQYKAKHMGRWEDNPWIARTAWTSIVNAFLSKYSSPAEGELIDPDDVRKGDRVRLVLENGDEATFTVTYVGASWISSCQNGYRKSDVTTVYLLHREET